MYVQEPLTLIVITQASARRTTQPISGAFLMGVEPIIGGGAREGPRGGRDGTHRWRTRPQRASRAGSGVLVREQRPVDTKSHDPDALKLARHVRQYFVRWLDASRRR
jgi:hypothetical protein